jgi:hypothetical protein
MMFWQLTIDANNPALLVRFWEQALGYQPVPPEQPDTTWNALYRARLGGAKAFDDRLFDPDGLRPPIWFQEVPETKAGKNRLHLDLYPTGRDHALPFERRIEIVETKVAELLALGASIERRMRDDDPDDPRYAVVMHDRRATSSASAERPAASALDLAAGVLAGGSPDHRDEASGHDPAYLSFAVGTLCQGAPC